MLMKLRSRIWISSLLAASLLGGLTTGCTKSRSPEIKDPELNGEIFEKAALDGKEFAIKTGGRADHSEQSLKYIAGSEKASVKIASSNAPDRLSRIFNGLSVQAKENQNYAVRFIIDKNAMHVLKIVKDD